MFKRMSRSQIEFSSVAFNYIEEWSAAESVTPDLSDRRSRPISALGNQTVALVRCRHSSRAGNSSRISDRRSAIKETSNESTAAVQMDSAFRRL